MDLNSIINTQIWELPVFKVLANNDTGAARGHQGGIVIPEAIRNYFPPLGINTSANNPTLEQIIKVELILESELLTTVDTRYQLQTWGGVRTPEYRVTGQLGPLRNKAQGNDILLIQRHTENHLLFRFILIRTTSDIYQFIYSITEGQRWGYIKSESGLNKKPMQKENIATVKPSLENVLSIDFDTTHWGALAFIARCARRFLECYENDSAEPSAQRANVIQAITIAEHRAELGGLPDEEQRIELNGQFFDNYDLDALSTALAGSVNAADNTWTDFHADKGIIELTSRRILTTIMLATEAFEFVLAQPDQSEKKISPSDLVKFAIVWSVWGEESIKTFVLDDYETLKSYITTKQLTNFDPIPKNIFGELWLDKKPTDWPDLELSFRPRARIIRTIGDRLISGPEAAVIELVKNSYDADASYVNIKFSPKNESGVATITFIDDGHGMSLKDIQEKWMEPATSEKRDKKSTAKGRKFLGSKGIGRFAASRLGRFLNLTSTAAFTVNPLISNGSRLATTQIPALDWNMFEETKYLDDVRFKVLEIPPADHTGTILAISDLRDEWPKSRIHKLYEELRKLVSPISNSKLPPFKIYLDLSECNYENSGFDGLKLFSQVTYKGESIEKLHAGNFEITPFPLLDACDYSVDGVFDEEGNFEGSFTILRGGLEPELIRLKVPLKLADGEQSCGIVLVRLHVFDRETEAIRSTAARAGFGAIGIREARKLLDDIAGVAIYREGFRIRPYGDEENDWLTLDAKRVQNPSFKIGRNQIAGIISVDDERNSSLIERSSREGLEENGSFRRLRSLISKLLAEMVEPKRRQFRISAGLDVRKESSFREVYDRVQMGWSKLLVAKMPEADRPAAEELIAKESERLRLYVKRLEDRQAQLEARVTLGLIVGEVMHQGNTPLSFLETESSRLKKWWPTILDQSEKSIQRLSEVPKILNGMEASGGKLRVLFDALNPLSGANRGEPKQYDVNEAITQTLYLFRSKIDEYNINIVVNGSSEKAFVIGYIDDLSTSLTNLIDNAIYWLKHHNIADPKIIVTTEYDTNKCVITVSDNGIGVPIEFSEQLFDVGFTLKPNGTGLGLSIAKEAIYRSNGELVLTESTEGTAFKISLPIA